MNKINSKTYTFASLVFFAIPTFSAEPILDFDGKSKAAENLAAFVAENSPVLSPELAQIKDSELFVKREILTETGKWVEVRPTGSWIGADGVKVNQFSILPDSKWRRTVRCLRRQWTAEIRYGLFPEQLGGHYHYDPPPPVLAISSISLSPSTAPFYAAPSPIIFPNLQQDTTFYYWEQLPAFATMIVEELYGCGGGVTDYIYVEVPGLSDMPYGQNYILDNPQDLEGYHPDNHYGTQKLIDTLKTVSDGYKAAFPNAEPLQINDMSLPWGGIFDLNYDWKGPREEHMIGADADIRKTTVPHENRQKLLEIMCSLTPGIFLEQDLPGEDPHYHLRVYGKYAALSDSLDGDNEKVTSCCKGNVIDPANLQICISAQANYKR